MRIRQISDVHLEHGNKIYIQNDNDWDVLLLGGDILVANHLTKSANSPYFDLANRYRDFFQEASDNYDKVFYIAGNHEYYDYRYDRTDDVLSDFVSNYSNIDFLHINNPYIDYKGVRFVGGTLWTDFYGAHPLGMSTVKACLNDYKCVKYFDGMYYRKLNPSDTLRDHYIYKQYIYDACIDQDKVVVMTHHAPCELSTDSRFIDDYFLNMGYHSRMANFILDLPQIRLWTHGHMHNASDYVIGDTRIVCNPYGYPKQFTGYDPDKVIIL